MSEYTKKNENVLVIYFHYVILKIQTWIHGEWIHVYVWLSLFTVHLKLSQHC